MKRIIIRLRNFFFPWIIERRNKKIERLFRNQVKVVTTNDIFYGIREEDCIPKDK